MNLSAKKPPEKDFFTIEDIANQWEIPCEQVFHYVFEQKTLKLAAKINTFELEILKASAIDQSKQGVIDDEFYYSVENSNQLTGKRFGCRSRWLLDYDTIDKSNIQKAHPILYLDVGSVMDVRLDGSDEEARELELYNAGDLAIVAPKLLLRTTNISKPFGFPLLATRFRTEANTLCYLICSDDRYLDREHNPIPFFVSLLLEDFNIITKVERDRFAIEHGFSEKPEGETPKERQTRLKKWFSDECRQNGERGALKRVADRECITRQTLSEILNRK